MDFLLFIITYFLTSRNIAFQSTFRWSDEELGAYLAVRRRKVLGLTDAYAAAWVQHANGLIGSLVHRCDEEAGKAGVCDDHENDTE